MKCKYKRISIVFNNKKIKALFRFIFKNCLILIFNLILILQKFNFKNTVKSLFVIIEQQIIFLCFIKVIFVTSHLSRNNILK